jgi:nitrate reductase NapAB chaperone NapD
MPDLYIASCIARVQERHLASTQRAIDAIPRCQVFKSDGVSKLVVVVEGCSTPDLLDTIALISKVDHVLNVNLVYQHAEDETIMQEAMPCN